MNDESKPRVGFILSGTRTGGTERFLLRVIARLGNDLQPIVFVRGARRGDLHEEFLRCGAEVRYFQLRYFDPVGTYRFIGLLRSNRLRSLVDFSGIFSGLSLWAAKLAGIQRRIAFHRRSSYAFKPTWHKMLYAQATTRLTEHVATHILANSQAALDFFHPSLRGNDGRLQVIRNFIDPAELLPTRTRKAVRNELQIPENAYVLMHTGRLDPAKDHRTLLAAALIVMATHKSVYCVVAGPGTETLREEQPAGDANELARFRYLGNRSDVPDLLNAADLYVFPSVTEGQPNALLEAILAGLPVVTTDIAPIREIIPERHYAHLTPPRDVNGLSRVISACVESREEGESRRYLEEVKGITDPLCVIPLLVAVFVGNDG
jgi:glycosyltransferase involved in cell wall biosynthesis